MGGEGTLEGGAGRPFYQADPRLRCTCRLLHKRLIDMMPPFFAGLSVAPPVLLR